MGKESVRRVHTVVSLHSTPAPPVLALVGGRRQVASEFRSRLDLRIEHHVAFALRLVLAEAELLHTQSTAQLQLDRTGLDVRFMGDSVSRGPSIGHGGQVHPHAHGQTGRQQFKAQDEHVAFRTAREHLARSGALPLVTARQLTLRRWSWCRRRGSRLQSAADVLSK